MVHDAWNRPVEWWEDTNGDGDLDDPGDTQLLACRYDGLNRRIRKVAKGTPDVAYDYFYNASWQVLEERKDADVYCQYVWSARYIDAPVLRDRDADGQSGNGLEERLYYTTDANMNVTALVGTDGAVVERYTYDPYGKVTVRAADWSEITWANSKKNEVLYCGYRFDPETGLYHVRHRYYHPSLGRWLSRDSVEYADEMNLLQYCRSAPSHFRDPQGLYRDGPMIPVPPDGFYGPVPLGYRPPPLPGVETSIYRIRGWPKGVHLWLSEPPPVPLDPVSAVLWPTLAAVYYVRPKIQAEVGHTVLSFDGPLGGAGADFVPPPAGRADIVLFPRLPQNGASTAETLVMPLDPTRGWIEAPDRLCIMPTYDRKLKHPSDSNIRCCDATEKQVRACVQAESLDWNGKTYFVFGPNCISFANAAMEACCLYSCEGGSGQRSSVWAPELFKLNLRWSDPFGW